MYSRSFANIASQSLGRDPVKRCSLEFRDSPLQVLLIVTSNVETMGKTPWLGGPITLHAWRMYECELPEKSQCEYAEGYWRFW